MQQGDIAFVTLFVHGPDGRPTWYVAPDALLFATGADGRPAFRGTLYSVNGPWLGAPFDPASVVPRVAGNLVVEPRPGGELLLQYVVDGVEVSRHVRRLAFGLPRLGGSYNAAFTLRVAASGAPPSGTREFRAGMEAAVDGSDFSMRVTEDVGSCEYRGAYVPQGRLGHVAGSFECLGGATGTFSIEDLEVTEHGLSGYVRMLQPGFEQRGRFAAARR